MLSHARSHCYHIPQKQTNKRITQIRCDLESIARGTKTQEGIQQRPLTPLALNLFFSPTRYDVPAEQQPSWLVEPVATHELHERAILFRFDIDAAVAVLLGAGAVHPDDAAEAFPLREQVERPVDVVESHLVRHELVQLQLLQAIRNKDENQHASRLNNPETCPDMCMSCWLLLPNLVEILLGQQWDVGLGLEPAEERPDHRPPPEDLVRRDADRRRGAAGHAQDDRLPPALQRNREEERRSISFASNYLPSRHKSVPFGSC